MDMSKTISEKLLLLINLYKHADQNVDKKIALNHHIYLPKLCQGTPPLPPILIYIWIQFTKWIINISLKIKHKVISKCVFHGP